MVSACIQLEFVNLNSRWLCQAKVELAVVATLWLGSDKQSEAFASAL